VGWQDDFVIHWPQALDTYLLLLCRYGCRHYDHSWSGPAPQWAQCEREWGTCRGAGKCDEPCVHYLRYERGCVALVHFLCKKEQSTCV
jgi:hypothetical protein